MMIDCGRCEMRGIGCRDCVIAAIESRNVTGYLPEAEVRALGVLADAGLVPPLRLTIAGTSPVSGARTWTLTVFPEARASRL
jgi:hypothetical protein